jgi:hypothetical protein
MRDMAKNANLTGKKTNHSARKSTCTKLLHAGIAPTTIQQLTGHKNVQSINNYAVASVEMQKTMTFYRIRKLPNHVSLLARRHLKIHPQSVQTPCRPSISHRIHLSVNQNQLGNYLPTPE